MIIEALCVFGGAVAKPLYDKFIEPLVDKEKSAIRLRCRADMLEGFAALNKSRKEAKESKKAAEVKDKPKTVRHPAPAGA
jgi:hypothetical protein